MRGYVEKVETNILVAFALTEFEDLGVISHKCDTCKPSVSVRASRFGSSWTFRRVTGPRAEVASLDPGNNISKTHQNV